MSVEILEVEEVVASRPFEQVTTVTLRALRWACHSRQTLVVL